MSKVKLRKGSIAWYKKTLRDVENAFIEKSVEHDNKINKLEAKHRREFEAYDRNYNSLNNEKASLKGELDGSNNVNKSLKIDMLEMEKTIARQEGIIESLDKHGKFKQPRHIEVVNNYSHNYESHDVRDINWVNR